MALHLAQPLEANEDAHAAIHGNITATAPEGAMHARFVVRAAGERRRSRACFCSSSKIRRRSNPLATTPDSSHGIQQPLPVTGNRQEAVQPMKTTEDVCLHGQLRSG